MAPKTSGVEKHSSLCFVCKYRMKSTGQDLLHTDTVIQREMVLKEMRQPQPTHLASAHCKASGHSEDSLYWNSTDGAT